MQQFDFVTAKTQMWRLLQSALDGEEVIITDENDRPVLKIVRVSDADATDILSGRDETVAKPYRQSGSAKGLISMSDDFDDPLEDFAEYMQ
jgi:antitoxin (DNA-binding transcriptional repressor) of toxin-antitoxin stability system